MLDHQHLHDFPSAYPNFHIPCNVDSLSFIEIPQVLEDAPPTIAFCSLVCSRGLSGECVTIVNKHEYCLQSWMHTIRISHNSKSHPQNPLLYPSASWSLFMYQLVISQARYWMWCDVWQWVLHSSLLQHTKVGTEHGSILLPILLSLYLGSGHAKEKANGWMHIFFWIIVMASQQYWPKDSAQWGGRESEHQENPPALVCLDTVCEIIHRPHAKPCMSAINRSPVLWTTGKICQICEFVEGKKFSNTPGIGL